MNAEVLPILCSGTVLLVAMAVVPPLFARRHRFREAKRLSRCLFAAAGLRRWR